MRILAIDPGKDKNGIALYDIQAKAVVLYQIVPSCEFASWLSRFIQEYPFEQVIVGDGTHSQTILEQVRVIAPQCMLAVVDEAYSTWEARQLYFELYPPRGLKRFLPRSLQTPARPIDDLVAIVLLKRYLGELSDIGI